MTNQPAELESGDSYRHQLYLGGRRSESFHTARVRIVNYDR